MSTEWKVFSWFMLIAAAVFGLWIAFAPVAKSALIYLPSKFALVPASPSAGMFPDPKPRRPRKPKLIKGRP